MTNNIIYIGPDVDDANFHGCALEPFTGEALDFKCPPTVKGLIRQVNNVQRAFPDHQVTL